MLSAVYFDNQAVLAADEVHKITSDWFLTNEFAVIDRTTR